MLSQRRVIASVTLADKRTPADAMSHRFYRQVTVMPAMLSPHNSRR